MDSDTLAVPPKRPHRFLNGHTSLGKVAASKNSPADTGDFYELELCSSDFNGLDSSKLPVLET